MAAVRPTETKFDPNKPLENVQSGPDDSKPAWIEDIYHPKNGFEFTFRNRLTAEDFLQRKNSRFWLIALKAATHLKQSILAVGHVGRQRLDMTFERGETPDVGETAPPAAESLSWQTAKSPSVSTPEGRVAKQMAAGANAVYTT